ncbi:MAG: pyridoxamine 5'-phosphate oxidase family protein [Candidatus Marinimicrobia bacterium]|nr:pyridoxamine 5'-phosphate oxidase family protein [Candidatus Neomarinimicrobiota bacterium]
MRRRDYSSGDHGQIETIAFQSEVGYLGIIDHNHIPRTVPLNFIYMDESVFFHGADEGEKFDFFSTNPNVSFSLVKPYSMIPSYWVARGYACPATQFYKSIYFKGVGTIEPDVEMKADILETFMKKYQPEGGYKKITTTDQLYKKALEEVSIFKIQIESVDLKFKFGQNHSVEKRQTIMEKLIERNDGLDKDTAEEIGKTLL